MFTGIIESLGRLKRSEQEGSNLHLSFECDFTDELKIDQSLAHNGVCLTVVAIDGSEYTVTAIDETLKLSNIGNLKPGDFVNLERCMAANGRYDGHIVQGHVDTMAECLKVEEKDGSWEYLFKHPSGHENLTVEKGSVTVNGVSLTVVHSDPEHFSVAIIPYTHEHTNFKSFEVGTMVNIEFDILGKYVARMMAQRMG
ncbi:MAG: riboflavin synthase [Bacteroidetes bacterium]|nr:riboflavin synthase [Bacteroidota bacterium]